MAALKCPDCGNAHFHTEMCPVCLTEKKMILLVGEVTELNRLVFRLSQQLNEEETK